MPFEVLPPLPFVQSFVLSAVAFSLVVVVVGSFFLLLYAHKISFHSLRGGHFEFFSVLFNSSSLLFCRNRNRLNLILMRAR